MNSVKSHESLKPDSVLFEQPILDIKINDDGVIYISQTSPLPEYNQKITQILEYFAKIKPDHVLFADKDEGGNWRKITYAQMYVQVKAMGQFLLNQGVSLERPLVILSGNQIEHAVLSLAAAHIGVPYAPISPAYSLISKDLAQLKGVFSLLEPSLVYVSDLEKFSRATDVVVKGDVKLLVGKKTDKPHDFDFETAIKTEPTDAVDEAFAKVQGSTIAKFLFTSGSTGSPKAVINSHEMICSNAKMVTEAFTYLKKEPPILLDWMPWHHTAGGNKVFYMTLFNGGSLYIDDGKPTVMEIDRTVRNLKEISPNWYFNVPKGYDALLAEFEEDAVLRESFYKNLKTIWYAGASMAQNTWDLLDKYAIETVGRPILIGSALGATETAPAATMCTWPQKTSGNIGLPLKGIILKLVPFEDKYDARVKGPSITQGYWKQPELTLNAFDEEGFYKFGDALRPVDENNLDKGFLFDGRTAENFKLDTGTWVATGKLRIQMVDHFGELISDVTITGADKSFLGALVFPNLKALRRIIEKPNATLKEVIANKTVQEIFLKSLQALAQESTGSSTLVRSIKLMDVPLSLDLGELTDKGSINQRKVLSNRSQSVDEIYNNAASLISITGEKK